MRIAILSTSYPRDEADPSGHFVQAQADRLAAAGHRVTVLAPGADGPVPEHGARVPLGAGGLFGWPGALAKLRARPTRLAELPAFVFRARRALRSAGPFDRVVAHFIVPSAWPIAASVDAPLEVRAHGADVRLLAAMPPSLAGSIVASLLVRGARFVFAASSLRAQLLDALPSRVAAELERASSVELPPLEMPRASALPTPWRDRGVALPYAVWVGRLVPEKRPALAARAAIAAGVQLVVVGDGPEALPSGVLRVGRVPREVALGWIAGARVLVSTSRDEAAPSAVREARALGVPVVATPAGDIREWSRTDAGILVVSTAAELGRALKASLTAPARDATDRR